MPKVIKNLKDINIFGHLGRKLLKYLESIGDRTLNDVNEDEHGVYVEMWSSTHKSYRKVYITEKEVNKMKIEICG